MKAPHMKDNIKMENQMDKVKIFFYCNCYVSQYVHSFQGKYLYSNGDRYEGEFKEE